MTSREVRISGFVSSRAMATLLVIMGLIMMWQTPDVAVAADPVAKQGLMFAAPVQWLSGSPQMSFAINLLCILAVAGVMTLLNNSFNILRNYSVAFVGLFMVMTAALPAASCRFQGASLLALTVLAAVGVMLSVYSAPVLSRRVYIAFLLIAAGVMWEYAFVVYIPVMVAGLIQMRAASSRTVIAALLGCLTPLWLIAAFMSWPLPWPALPSFENPFASWPVMTTVRFWSAVGLTLVVGTIFGVVNLVSIFGYNAKARAVNGLLTLVSVATAIFCLIDFTNAGVYVVLLNACVAFQAGHFLVINSRRRSYLLMIILPVAYIGLWIWTLIAV